MKPILIRIAFSTSHYIEFAWEMEEIREKITIIITAFLPMIDSITMKATIPSHPAPPGSDL